MRLRTLALLPAVVVVAMAATQSASATTSPIPIVATGLAVNVVAGSETVEGTVNSNGEAATYRFDFGTSTNYGQQTISEPILNTTPELVDAAVTNLAPNTVYHYRIEATDAWGTSYGADQTFTSGAGTSTGGTSGGGTSGGSSPSVSFTAIAVVIHNRCGFIGMFNASTSLPAVGTSITQYAWSFGDGTSAITTSPTAYHGYHAGSYRVVLTVTDSDGTSASQSRAISGGSGSLYCS